MHDCASVPFAYVHDCTGVADGLADVRVSSSLDNHFVLYSLYQISSVATPGSTGSVHSVGLKYKKTDLLQKECTSGR